MIWMGLCGSLVCPSPIRLAEMKSCRRFPMKGRAQSVSCRKATRSWPSHGVYAYRALVVMAITARLAAKVMLPVVQQIREAARCSQCLNNTAGPFMANYMSSNRSYPSGWICSTPGCSQLAPLASMSFTNSGTGKFKLPDKSIASMDLMNWVVGPDWSWRSSCCSRWMSGRRSSQCRLQGGRTGMVPHLP